MTVDSGGQADDEKKTVGAVLFKWQHAFLKKYAGHLYRTGQTSDVSVSARLRDIVSAAVPAIREEMEASEHRNEVSHV